MLTFILSMLLAADPTTITGKVVSVVDGDTIHVLTIDQTGQKQERKIRLIEIDAPEKQGGQPFWQQSKQALSDRVFGKVVRVEWREKDRYERPLGTVFLGEENVNHWLVREGWAWRYDRYSRSEELLRLQVEAKAARRGLWADSMPIPPWEFRRPKRERQTRPLTPIHQKRK